MLTFLSSGCLSCRYETQRASRTAAMTNNQHTICFAHSKHNGPLFIQRVRFVVFEKSIIIMEHGRRFLKGNAMFLLIWNSSFLHPM